MQEEMTLPVLAERMSQQHGQVVDRLKTMERSLVEIRQDQRTYQSLVDAVHTSHSARISKLEGAVAIWTKLIVVMLGSGTLGGAGLILFRLMGYK